MATCVFRSRCSVLAAVVVKASPVKTNKIFKFVWQKTGILNSSLRGEEQKLSHCHVCGGLVWADSHRQTDSQAGRGWGVRGVIVGVIDSEQIESHKNWTDLDLGRIFLEKLKWWWTEILDNQIVCKHLRIDFLPPAADDAAVVNKIIKMCTIAFQKLDNDRNFSSKMTKVLSIV